MILCQNKYITCRTTEQLCIAGTTTADPAELVSRTFMVGTAVAIVVIVFVVRMAVVVVVGPSNAGRSSGC